ncbi:MAG TPA: hypothetical protein VMV29_12850 [Ktedonobacterales bacterium]|nr:hypothetical protein [Ktedonobacterales bacterium]
MVAGEALAGQSADVLVIGVILLPPFAVGVGLGLGVGAGLGVLGGLIGRLLYKG